jgi:NADH-quinone oxidoreductase subunit M
MIGHGIISSALFFLVGIVYDRYHTRLLRYYGGLIQVMPIFGILFFIFTLGNIGFPGTSNFIGETLILVGIFEKNILIAIFTGFGIILSAVYSL